MQVPEIKKIRKQLGITQKQLAEISGVSQSLIAKLESGIIDAGYSKVSSIIKSLEEAKAKQEPLAKDIMVKKIISCKPWQKIKDIIKLMKAYEISQIPVMENKSIIGIVTESSIMEKVLKKNFHALLAKDIMQQAPPIISPNTPESAVLPLLKHFSLIIVMDKGMIRGIITKADIIRRI